MRWFCSLHVITMFIHFHSFSIISGESSIQKGFRMTRFSVCLSGIAGMTEATTNRLQKVRQADFGSWHSPSESVRRKQKWPRMGEMNSKVRIHDQLMQPQPIHHGIHNGPRWMILECSGYLWYFEYNRDTLAHHSCRQKVQSLVDLQWLAPHRNSWSCLTQEPCRVM